MNWITHQNFDPHIAKSAAAQTLGFRSCDAKTFLSAKFSVSFDCFLSAELSTQRNYCNHVDKLKVRRHSLNNVFYLAMFDAFAGKLLLDRGSWTAFQMRRKNNNSHWANTNMTWWREEEEEKNEWFHQHFWAGCHANDVIDGIGEAKIPLFISSFIPFWIWLHTFCTYSNASFE